MTSGHKYMLKRTGSYSLYDNTCRVVSTTETTKTYQQAPNVAGSQAVIFTCDDTRSTYFVQAYVVANESYDFYLNVFDLTAMFDSGNEPSTVAEFEALYPLSYYPYDAGSLLSVQMEGIETVGFNQWDEEWEVGSIAVATGQNIAENNAIRSKNYSPCFPDTEYYIKSTTAAYVFWYRADKSYISNVYTANSAKTSPAGAAYFRVRVDGTNTYNHDICINISYPTRNGEYEPFWRSERTIPATDLRSAGTVYDEQTATERITRVGAVDLGSLSWNYNSSNPSFYAENLPIVAQGYTNASIAPMTCAKYETVAFYDNGAYFGGLDKVTAFAFASGRRLYVKDTSFGTNAATFKAAMDGVILYYALATPTTQPITPPLNLTYRVSDFGTERILHTDPTAAPTLVVTYGITADGIRDRALACIAPVENGRASANYGVGSYLIHGGTLCRVTTAIAAGEAITIGTNVTATTVMAELLTLTQ